MVSFAKKNFTEKKSQSCLICTLYDNSEFDVFFFYKWCILIKFICLPCSDEEMLKLNIHFGGTMKKEADDYIYLNESGFKNVLWKMSEISWKKFQDFNKAEGIATDLRLIWYKETSEEMKNINYVFEDLNGDISDKKQ